MRLANICWRAFFCVQVQKPGNEQEELQVTTNAIKLTSPHELLAVVPYLLGFTPANSIVTLCLSRHRLGLAQRLDLPRPEDAYGVAQALMPSLVKEKPAAVIIIVYEDNEGESLPALEELTKAPGLRTWRHFSCGSEGGFDLVAQDEVGSGVTGFRGGQVLTEFSDGGGGSPGW